MSRVYKTSQKKLSSNISVVRHELPSTSTVGAKPSVSNSNVSSSMFSDLPTVLHDYIPESPTKRKVLVKPRKTIRSLDPSLSPHRNLSRPKVHSVVAANSAPQIASFPIVSNPGVENWSQSHLRQCYSSRSHSRLKELKDEINAFRESDKKMKLRSRLYEKCGVVLNDVGIVATDKAVQVDSPNTDRTINTERSFASAADRSMTSVRARPLAELLFHRWSSTGEDGPIFTFDSGLQTSQLDNPQTCR
ncbi:hypothetical protein ACJJTC_002216 [Scirpophaga incertulas]